MNATPPTVQRRRRRRQAPGQSQDAASGQPVKRAGSRLATLRNVLGAVLGVGSTLVLAVLIQPQYDILESSFWVIAPLILPGLLSGWLWRSDAALPVMIVTTLAALIWLQWSSVSTYPDWPPATVADQLATLFTFSFTALVIVGLMSFLHGILTLTWDTRSEDSFDTLTEDEQRIVQIYNGTTLVTTSPTPSTRRRPKHHSDDDGLAAAMTAGIIASTMPGSDTSCSSDHSDCGGDGD